MVDDLVELLERPAVSMGLVGALLLGGLLVDLTTRQDLVVAIIYNIPIAISGVGLQSRRVTRWTILLALGANLSAAYENALQAGGYDAVTVTNRGFAALSFLIVGAMTLARERAAEEVSSLTDAEQASEREHDLRHVVLDLSAERTESDLLHAAVPALRELLGAQSVVIAAIEDGRFCEPRYGDADSDDLAPVGSLAGWAVDAIPNNDRPAITVRSDVGLMTTGRWKREGASDLVVVAEDPRTDKSAYLLGEALHSLFLLLRRARRSDADEEGAASTSDDTPDDETPDDDVRQVDAADDDPAGDADPDGAGDVTRTVRPGPVRTASE